jgi:hypothetical protein
LQSARAWDYWLRGCRAVNDLFLRLQPMENLVRRLLMATAVAAVLFPAGQLHQTAQGLPERSHTLSQTESVSLGRLSAPGAASVGQPLT